MKNKDKILDALKDGPLSFTQVKSTTGLENGVLQHHISSNNKITKKRGAIMMKDECSGCEFREPCSTACIRKILKDSKKNRIISLLNKGHTQTEIAEELGLSAPTIYHHISSMRDKGIIEDNTVVTPVAEKLN